MLGVSQVTWLGLADPGADFFVQAGVVADSAAEIFELFNGFQLISLGGNGGSLRGGNKCWLEEHIRLVGWGQKGWKPQQTC